MCHIRERYRGRSCHTREWKCGLRVGDVAWRDFDSRLWRSERGRWCAIAPTLSLANSCSRAHPLNLPLNLPAAQVNVGQQEALGVKELIKLSNDQIENIMTDAKRHMASRTKGGKDEESLTLVSELCAVPN